jgi:hypothetical protein
MSWDSRGELFPLTSSGRIIVDTEAFMRFNPQRSERYEDLHDEDFTISDAPTVQAKNSRLSRAEANFAEEAVAPVVKLTEEAYLICKSTLLGYSLKLKKWRKCSINPEHSALITNRQQSTSSSTLLRKLCGTTTHSIPSFFQPTPRRC